MGILLIHFRCEHITLAGIASDAQCSSSPSSEAFLVLLQVFFILHCNVNTFMVEKEGDDTKFAILHPYLDWVSH